MTRSKSFVRYWIYCIITFALIGCSSAPPPETQAAILSLKGLNSKLSVGINIGEYVDALQDVKVTVDRSIEVDPKSKSNLVIKKAMSGHLAALGLWRCKTEDIHYQDECKNNVYETVIFPLYPELQKEIEPRKETIGSRYIYSVDHDAVLQLLWKSSETDLNSLIGK